MNIGTSSKTLIVLCVCFLVAVSVIYSPPSLGKSAKEKKIDQNRTKRDKLYDLIRDLNQDEEQLATITATLDGKIERLEEEILSIKTQYEQANTEQLQFEEDQAKLEDDLQDYKANLRKRTRAIYMQGDLTYLDLVFQATSFGDAIDRLYFIQTIVERDKAMVEHARDAREDLDVKIVQIATQKTEINRIQEILELQQGELEETRGDKQLLIEAINNDKALFEKQIKSIEEENVKFMKEIREYAKSAAKWNKKWDGNFAKPCKGSITSGYGMRKHPILGVRKMHTGVDIGAPKGTRVTVGGEGKVIFTGTKRGYGKTVIVDHGNNRTTLYAHLSKISCEAGNHLQEGAKVGEVGSTGYSSGNHLHFEVRINGETVDPFKHLN